MFKFRLRIKNVEDRIPPKNNDDERNQSLNQNGEYQVKLNKKQANNRKLPKKPYAEV